MTDTDSENEVTRWLEKTEALYLLKERPIIISCSIFTQAGRTDQSKAPIKNIVNW